MKEKIKKWRKMNERKNVYDENKSVLFCCFVLFCFVFMRKRNIRRNEKEIEIEKKKVRERLKEGKHNKKNEERNYY